MKIQELLLEVKVSVLATLALLIILCGAYPLVVWGVAQVAFPSQANGSLVEVKGQIVGSGLLAQNFSGAQYFHPRPSAAGDTGFDGTSSGGSNLGPLSQKLSDQVKERVEKYRAENNLPAGTLVPADAVTASGSGLDPHISLKNAELQAKRVATARGLSPAQINKLIESCTAGPGLGFLGEPGVNVLRLNLALDKLVNKSPGS
ncbi:MAG: K(+)-transporting ATPase subunit C [Desulfobaccales bacterium]